MDSQQLKKTIKKIDDYNNQNHFKDTWESLYDYEVPKWYKDAKLGIFFHYGIYTVPQMGSEWYSRYMYDKGSKAYEYHLKTYGDPKEFGYKQFIDLFKAEKFNAEEWIDLASSLGAKYLMPVAEHHDGFQMYKSEVSKFNSYDMGPKIDFISELNKVCQEKKLYFTVSSHRAEHYWFMSESAKFDSGITDTVDYGDMYWPNKQEEELANFDQTAQLFLEDWLVRCCELVDKYAPRVMYFDWWVEMPEFKPYMRKFLAYFYNKNMEIYGDCGVVNYKHDGIPYGVAVRDVERGNFATMQNDYWQCCTSIARGSWSYVEENDYKTANELIQTLIDVISKNGNLLLNSGPRADGSFDPKETAIVKQFGAWVKNHEKAIYQTRVWKVFGEGDTNTNGGNFSENTELKYKKYDIRFTKNKNKVYVFILNPSEETKFEIKSMARSKGVLTHHAVIKDVEVVTPGIKIDSWKRTKNCLDIQVERHDYNLPIVFEVEVE